MADFRDNSEMENTKPENSEEKNEITGTIEKFEEISLDDTELYGGDSEDEMEEDDVDMWDGENPIDLEVEKYCQPSKRTIIKEISNANIKRNLIVHPLNLDDMKHPVILTCIHKCSNFKFSYYTPDKFFSNTSEKTWLGMLELIFHSAFDAEDAVEPLKTIRENVNIVSSSSQGTDLSQMVAKWSEESLTSSNINIKDMNIVLVKNLPTEVTTQGLRNLIPSSSEIIIPAYPLTPNKNKDDKGQAKKTALVFFLSSDLMTEVLTNHETTPLQIGPSPIKLKILAYLPPQLPNGLLKMDRRYKEMVHLRELKKIYKEKFNTLSQEQKKKLIDTIKRCRNFLERDNKARTELNLPLHSWKELRKVRVVRESIPPGTQWFPLTTSSNRNNTNNEVSSGSKTKKRRVDHRKSNRSVHPHFAGNYTRNEHFPPSGNNLGWKPGNFMNGGFGKNQWAIPPNFPSYNLHQMAQIHEVAAMMNQMTCNPSYLGNFLATNCNNSSFRSKFHFQGQPQSRRLAHNRGGLQSRGFY